ncbi:MAG: glycosyltransferase family 39 protein [Candidatus Delongbacteria bacterium]|nr:glycosyltransferase family 39 protein [Candidatus Delongbacteria bacterium]
MIWNEKRTRMTVILLLGLGVFLRFYFYFGHVYSDDAYYNYLAYTFYKGNFGADYLGYPICFVRMGQTWLTAFAFWLFGTNEAATTVFPMIFSIFNMVLAYKLTKIITKSEINSVLVLLFTVFYPTEILFASIAFTDLFSTVFIHSGILLLFIADRDKKLWYSVIAGVLFFVSVLFKINVFYTSILLSGLILYQLYSRKVFNKYIFTSLAVLGAGMIFEGVIYYFINGDFFYRLTAMSSMSTFSAHDFVNQGDLPDIIENIKAVLLRRTMVFIPLLAVIQMILHRKKRKNRLVVYWFSGLVLLYLFFTMTFTEYKPMPLRFTWYLFPLFLPSMMLASKLLSEMKKGWMFFCVFIYITAALYYTDHFRGYFNMDEISDFNNFLRDKEERVIYTDHFTKYSIDLIDGHKEPSRTVRLSFEEESCVPAGSLIAVHTGHTSELAKQGFVYPDESSFISDEFEELKRFGPFIIYEKK